MPLLATLPLVLPFTLLVIFRQSGMRASLITAIVSLPLAILFLPDSGSLFTLSASSIENAIAIGFGVLTVLFPGLWLYRLQVVTGGLTKCIAVLQRSFRTPEVRVLVLVIAVSPFVESISGFGVCVLVVAPLLVALDIAPIRAGLLVLLSQISIPLGALGVGTMVGAQLSGLPVDLVGTQSLILSAPLPAIHALAALHIFGGVSALKRYWWLAIIAGVVKGVLDPLFASAMSIEVAGALSAACVIALFFAIDRMLRAASDGTDVPVGRSVLVALVPYTVLVATLVITRTVPPIRDFLSGIAVVDVFGSGFTYPLFYIPGFWILVAIAATIATSRPPTGDVFKSVDLTWRQFYPAGVTILGFLFIAQIMVFSGMARSVALAASSLGDVYVLAAPVLGAVGGWLTASNSGGNAMFVPLQVEIAKQLGMSKEWIVAANNAAASYGTVGSPGRVTLVSVTMGHRDLESELMHKAAPYVVLATALIAVALFITLKAT